MGLPIFAPFFLAALPIVIYGDGPDKMSRSAETVIAGCCAVEDGPERGHGFLLFLQVRPKLPKQYLTHASLRDTDFYDREF